MNTKKKLKNYQKQIAENLLDIKGLLTAILDLEQDYPSNMLTEMALKKVISVFYKNEICRNFIRNKVIPESKLRSK